jgi:hypothetical protein
VHFRVCCVWRQCSAECGLECGLESGLERPSRRSHCLDGGVGLGQEERPPPGGRAPDAYSMLILLWENAT